MEPVYPYAIEVVSSKRVSIPRPVGSGVALSETLRVDLPLLRKFLPGLSTSAVDTRRQLIERSLEEAKSLAFEKFVLFLQIVSEYQSEFPKELLRRSNERKLVVLLPTACWSAARSRLDVGTPPRGAVSTRFEDFELDLLAHPRLADDEAFIVGLGKFRLYLHAQALRDEARVFRSDFLDASNEAIPPVALRAGTALSALFEGVDAVGDSGRSSSRALTMACPRCRGRLTFLSANEAFCMSCDWDNLKTLPAARFEIV